MVFPTRLRQIRQQRKLTQEQLGKKVNVTKVSISGYESGNRTPDMETLQKLAEALDVSVDYLLGLTDEQFSVRVAGQEIELTPEEFKVFREMKKHPDFAPMFHDLATDTEYKVKRLIKMWEFIKKDIEEMEKDNRDDIIED